MFSCRMVIKTEARTQKYVRIELIAMRSGYRKAPLSIGMPLALKLTMVPTSTDPRYPFTSVRMRLLFSDSRFIASSLVIFSTSFIG